MNVMCINPQHDRCANVSSCFNISFVAKANIKKKKIVVRRYSTFEKYLKKEERKKNR